MICLSGGPMSDSEYLGNLGGLSEHHRLILLDHRGTGQSATPEDPASYRCDRLVDDVEALREHLGLTRINLLAHSGGTNLAVLYASQHPERIGKLVLVGPSAHAVGFTVTPEATRAALATFDAPVLLLAGEVDVNSPPRVVNELAELFPNATIATQPGAAHCPWLDDSTWFTKVIASFLG